MKFAATLFAALLVLLAALARLGVRQVPMLPIYRDRELAFCMSQTGASLLCVPAVWRGNDYAEMAERVRAEHGGFTIRVCDRALPDADPSMLPPAPTSASLDV